MPKIYVYDDCGYYSLSEENYSFSQVEVDIPQETIDNLNRIFKEYEEAQDFLHDLYLTARKNKVYLEYKNKQGIKPSNTF